MISRVWRYLIILGTTFLSIYINYTNYENSIGASHINFSLSQFLINIIPSFLFFIPLLLAELRLYADEKSISKSLEVIQNKLELPIKHLFSSEESKNIRANIMRPVISWHGLTIKKALKVVCDYNMDGWRRFDEKDLVWEIGKGACGQAMYRAFEYEDQHRWTPILFDRTKIESDDVLKSKWNIPDINIERTKHIVWVISIPIIFGENKPKFLGILNIDGTAPLNNNQVLFDQQFHDKCKAWGLNFGVIIKDEGILNWMKRGW